MEIKSILPLFLPPQLLHGQNDSGWSRGLLVFRFQVAVLILGNLSKTLLSASSAVAHVGMIYRLLYLHLKINTPVQCSPALACIQTWDFTSVDGFFAI